jgi:hypothetical protein
MNTATLRVHDVPTFVDIDRSLTNLGVVAATPAAESNKPLQKVLMMFALLRPLFLGMAALPIIPNSWRIAVQLFVAALDALAASNTSAQETAVEATAPVDAGDFKAGKDL